MTSSAHRRLIDDLRTTFRKAGISQPFTIIEQITFLIHARLLDIDEAAQEATGQPFPHRFGDNEQHLRWSSWRNLEAEQMLALVHDQVFPHLRACDARGEPFRDLMKDARLEIESPVVLSRVVALIDALPLADRHARAGPYEYLLTGMTRAGLRGQFMTPQPLARLMVAILDPAPGDIIGDPVCGTGGFLVAALDSAGTRDLIGFDLDPSMLRIAATNLVLHGADRPRVHFQDTLSRNFAERHADHASEGFDAILAHPPFGGAIDVNTIDPGLNPHRWEKRADLLFLPLIQRMLKPSGRAAMIVPEAMLSRSSRAHHLLRRQLIENHRVEAVLALPRKALRPFATLPTAIIVFTRDGTTDDVFFYAFEDGSVDEARTEECLESWRSRDPSQDRDLTARAFFVSASEIRDTRYNLSVHDYRHVTVDKVVHEPPEVVLGRMKTLNREIAADLARLEAWLTR